MERSSDVCHFLMSRRARITPEQAAAVGGSRRVRGLRREEVAALAGISVDYYTKLERGKVAGISASVFAGLVRALQLDEAERTYLATLVTVSGLATASQAQDVSEDIEPDLARILEAIVGVPAYIRNHCFDILAANELGEALYLPLFANPSRPVNTARFVFLDPRAAHFFIDWETVADLSASFVRSAAALHPTDRELANLIDELYSRSEHFRSLWADHNVRFHRTGTKRINHPLVGELTLKYQSFDVAGRSGLRLNTYTAAPGSQSAKRLQLLATRVAEYDSGREGAHQPAGSRT